MTIPQINLLPKRCDKCKRRFWLEPFEEYTKIVGLFGEQMKVTVCGRCQEKERREDAHE